MAIGCNFCLAHLTPHKSKDHPGQQKLEVSPFHKMKARTFHLIWANNYPFLSQGCHGSECPWFENHTTALDSLPGTFLVLPEHSIYPIPSSGRSSFSHTNHGYLEVSVSSWGFPKIIQIVNGHDLVLTHIETTGWWLGVFPWLRNPMEPPLTLGTLPLGLATFGLRPQHQPLLGTTGRGSHGGSLTKSPRNGR